MISTKEAKRILLDNTLDFGTEVIPFFKATGRVLKEDIIADRDFTPFNRVAMDGIALNYHFFNTGVRGFKIEGLQPAGAAQKTLKNPANCYEVMTGASLPIHTDTVVPYEDVNINNSNAWIKADTISQGQNIHKQAADNKLGAVLINKNSILSPAEINVLATVGKFAVRVAKLPKVLIVSTGDELVEVNKTPLPYQIRKSNVFALLALLEQLQIRSEVEHLNDNKKVIEQKVALYLQKYDVLLFSGAVSKGKFDFLPSTMNQLGVKELFHRVSQRPGKPFWMGLKQADKQNTVIFGFPGNPISTFVNCLVYFYPWYFKSVLAKQRAKNAVLSKDISFKPNMTYFLPVKLYFDNGQLKANPIKASGSADLVSLVNADAFIEIPQTKEIVFKKGRTFPLFSYRYF
ncbi:MAG: molybdopterin molybdotransferase MoeA [Tenacibaculum sp.]